MQPTFVFMYLVLVILKDGVVPKIFWMPDYVNMTTVIYGCCWFYNIIKPTIDRLRGKNKILGSATL